MKFVTLIKVFASALFTAQFSFTGLASEEDNPLLGLWGGERFFTSAAPIRIVLQQEGEQLLAHAKGHRAVVKIDKGEVRFTFANSVGSFRGQRHSETRLISGHWISEPEFLVYSPMATPVILEFLQNGLWQGYVKPIEQRFALYINISMDESGTMRAFLRNPERNQGVNTRLHAVSRTEKQVQFSDADNNIVLEGQFDQDTDVLSVAMDWRGGTYNLTRRDRKTAAGFFPRSEEHNYTYKQPLALNDGWAVSGPQELGLNQQQLEQFVQSIIDTQTTSLRTPYIHSLLVARQGKLVLEEYFYGYHADRVHDLRSATKSVTGLMVGKMIDEVETIDVNSLVYPLFPTVNTSAKASQSTLAIRHLLSMSSGFDCDDNNEQSLGNEDRMQEQNEQKDWYKYTLGLPLVAPPGDVAVYCSGAINLLGGVISQLTKEWLPEFFRSRFAVPLQIEHYHMNLDPLQRGYAGGGMHMRPRDFLKFAQLMQNNGSWNGQQVLQSAWVQQSLKAHASIYQADDYGYTWWRGVLPVGDGFVKVYSATGNGGQMLVIIPEFELVVGLTGGNYGDFRTWIAWRDELIPKYLIRALVH